MSDVRGIRFGKDIEYVRGQWKALDRVLIYLNEVDTGLYSTKELKKKIYHDILKMLPEREES